MVCIQADARSVIIPPWTCERLDLFHQNPTPISGWGVQKRRKGTRFTNMWSHTWTTLCFKESTQVPSWTHSGSALRWNPEALKSRTLTLGRVWRSLAFRKATIQTRYGGHSNLCLTWRRRWKTSSASSQMPTWNECQMWRLPWQAVTGRSLTCPLSWGAISWTTLKG